MVYGAPGDASEPSVGTVEHSVSNIKGMLKIDTLTNPAHHIDGHAVPERPVPRPVPSSLASKPSARSAWATPRFFST